MKSAVKESEKTVINKIYDEYYSWLLQRAYRRVHDISVCEDLFNDCVICWINHMEMLEKLTDGRLKAYAAKSIDKACYAYLKQNRDVVFMSDKSEKTEYIEDDIQNVEMLIEEKYTYDVMKSSFEKLSKKERDVIIMKYNLRMKDREMAAVMGIKENSVRMTVNRCVKKLSKIMEKEMK